MKSVRMRFLAAIGTLGVLLVLFFAVFLIYHMKTHAEREAGRIAALAAAEADDKLSLFMQELRYTLQFLAASYLRTGVSADRLHGLLYDLHRSGGGRFRAIYIGTADGIMYERGSGPGFVAGRPRLPSGYDPRLRPWYKNAVASQRFSLTGPYPYATHLISGVTASLPVLSGNRTVAVAGIDLPRTNLEQLLNRIVLPFHGRCALFSPSGQMLAAQSPGVGDVALQKVVQQLQGRSSDRTGGRFMVQIGGALYLGAMQRNRESGWLVAAVIRYDRLMQETDRLLLVLLAGMGIVALLIPLMLYTALGRLLQPVSRLRDTIRSFGSGMTGLRADIYAEDEFGELAAAFNAMADSLVEQNQRIREVNQDLEERVAQRTATLASLNDQLAQQSGQIRHDLAMARRIQLGLIPRGKDNRRPEFVFSGNCTAMQEIGGDIYDVIRVGRNAYAFLMGDVSGHGVSAALITALAKVLFTAHAHWGIPAGDICAAVNRDMFLLIGDQPHYLSAFFGVLNLENGELSYCNAGHCPAFHIGQGRMQGQFLRSNATFIGAFEAAVYPTVTIQFDPGDRLILFTDGIVEARSPEGGFYREERLWSRVHNGRGLPVDRLVADILDDLAGFTGGRPPDDDRALLAVEFLCRCEK